MPRMQDTFARSIHVAVAAALSAGLAGACGTSGTSSAPAADVWASVDGRDIKRDDVERVYRGTVDTTTSPPSEDEALGLKLGVLDEMINQDVLVARAVALKAEPTDTEVETAFVDRKRGVSDAVFQEQMTQRNLTAEDVKKSIRRELTVQKVLERDVTSKVVVTDDDISAFFNKNKAQFNFPEAGYHLAQIIVTGTRNPQLRNRANDDAASPAEAQRKVTMLLDRLKAGAEFGSLAMDYSEDPQTVGQGGDLGFVPTSALSQAPAQYRDVVLKTSPGSISTVPVGGDAIAVVLVVSKEAAGQRDLDTPSVRDGIRDTIRERREALLRSAYLTSARNDAKIVNYLARQIVETQSKAAAAQPPALPTK